MARSGLAQGDHDEKPINAWLKIPEQMARRALPGIRKGGRWAKLLQVGIRWPREIQGDKEHRKRESGSEALLE